MNILSFNEKNGIKTYQLHSFLLQMSDRGNVHIVEDPRYKKMKIICILEGACLETVKTKKVNSKSYSNKS